MLRVQVRMVEAGIVHVGQRFAEPAGQPAPARGIALPMQEQAEIDGPRQFTNEQEGPAVTVLAGGEPFRTGNAGTMELAEDRCLAAGMRDETEACPGVGQPAAPGDAMLSLEERGHHVVAAAESDAQNVAVGMAADDHPGQSEEAGQGRQACAAPGTRGNPRSRAATPLRRGTVGGRAAMRVLPQ